MVEYLDVVDENDEVVDVQSRQVVHRDDLMHRAVHVLVFRNDGRMLIQKRSMSKDNNPGLWDTSVGGHVNSGENYDQCAQRETGEELGIYSCVEPERLFKVGARPETGYEHIWVYRLRWNDEINFDPVEIDDVRWISVSRLDEEIRRRCDQYTSSIRIILEKALREGIL